MKGKGTGQGVGGPGVLSPSPMLTGCMLAGQLPVASSVRWGTVFAWPSLHRHGGYEIQGHVRQETLVVKVTGFRSEGPGLKCCPSHLLAV